MTDLAKLLSEATTILLVDWPNQEVPAALVRGGWTAVAPRHPPDPSASPFLSHEVSSRDPRPEDGVTFPLSDGARLFFLPLDALPSTIDIVSTFRPAEEQPAVVEEAIRLGARAVWVEPGESVSTAAREHAEGGGLRFVEGTSIADMARELGSRSSPAAP